MFSKHDIEEQKMRRCKMPSKTVAAPTEDELCEYATELQIMATLQFMPPFPLPFIPHFGEFSELANIRMRDRRRRGRS